jgi:hypothetical protein
MITNKLYRAEVIDVERNTYNNLMNCEYIDIISQGKTV